MKSIIETVLAIVVLAIIFIATLTVVVAVLDGRDTFPDYDSPLESRNHTIVLRG